MPFGLQSGMVFRTLGELKEAGVHSMGNQACQPSPAPRPSRAPAPQPPPCARTPNPHLRPNQA